MTLAITLTFSMPMGVSAATASLNVEEAKWTANNEITVQFGQNVTVSDDAKDQIQGSTAGYGDITATINAEKVVANGNKVVITLPDNAETYKRLAFPVGSVMNSNGVSAAATLNVNSISADSSVTSASLDPTSLEAEGGKVVATVEGTLLHRVWYNYTLYDKTNSKTVNGTTSYEGDNAKVSFDVPENTGTEDITYEFRYNKNYYGNGIAVSGCNLTVKAKKSSESTDTAITSWSADKTTFDSKGGDVTVSIQGTGLKALDKSAFELEKMGKSGWMTQEYDIAHTYTATSDTEATVKFTLPKNTEETDAQYRITAKKNADALQDKSLEFTVQAASKEAPTPVIKTMSTKTDSIEGKGGTAVIDITGENLTQLTKDDFELTNGKTGDKVDMDMTYTAASDTEATLSIQVKANTTDSVIQYTVKAVRGGNNTADFYLQRDKSKAMFTFKNDLDTIKAYSYSSDDPDNPGTKTVEVKLGELDTVQLPDNWRELIYFDKDGRGTGDKVFMTEDDTATINGNVITFEFRKAKSIPAYINFMMGSLINDKGEILGKNVFHYMQSGATVNGMSYNQITFDSKGGEAVVTIKGNSLKSSNPELGVKIYKDNGKEDTGIKTNIKVNALGDQATVTFTVPANDTKRVQSYRVMPVVNGINTYSTYIKGYDVISVLPEGEDPADNKARLASIELNGGNDEDDAVDVYKTTLRSSDFTLKFDAILRGTNLSAKKTAVKVVDENGIEWPVTPVKECGATVRWQRSSSFMKDKESKNEQKIEFLAPRCLGTTHTYKMYFAVDGKNFDDEAVGTITIVNDGLYEPELGFTLEELTQLRTGNIKYVDTNGKEIAEAKTFKGYGVTELYKIGAVQKEIKGYKFSKCNVNTHWFEEPVFNEEKQLYEFPYGQHFVKDLNGQDIVFTYEAEGGSTPTPTPSEPEVSQSAPKVKLSTTKYTYSGKTRMPSVTVTQDGKKLSAKDYTVSYASGRKNVGKYAVKVTLKSNKKSATAYFTINPKGTSLKSVKKAKKAFTAKWKKQATQVTGYQVQYSKSKKFTGKTTKVKTVSGAKKTSKKITKLSKKKTYYVRVRTYKTVKGVKYYSAWSKAKKVKTK